MTVVEEEEGEKEEKKFCPEIKQNICSEYQLTAHSLL